MVAGGLADFIDQIRVDYGDPDLAVDILAHSNGGLLARYFVRYGRALLTAESAPEATGAGARAVRRLVMVGTPNLGTIQPVLSHLRGEEIGLRKIRPEVMATCPGATQLLPHPHVTWLVDLRGRDVKRDVFAIETWQEFRWSVFAPSVRARVIARNGGGKAGRGYLEVLERYFAKQLRQGRRFSETLAEPHPADLEPYLFGGDCSPTLARLVLEMVGRRAHARERPQDITAPLAGVDYSQVMFEPGDLVVTRDSMLARRVSAEGERHALKFRQSMFLCEEHRQFTGNATFQDNLLYTLLQEEPA